MSRSTSIALAIILAFMMSFPVPCRSEEKMSFDSPGVMNLSGYLRHTGLPLQGYAPIKTDRLPSDDAWPIVEARQIDRGDQQFVRLSGVFDRKAEKIRIAADKKTVSRAGESLVIKPASGPSVTFKDWLIPETDQHDGDGQSFVYIGRLARNGFYRVEVLYGHDSPGSFFINPKNGRIVYAHNSTHTTAMSPDGNIWLL